ncbi:MAG: outer membrane protein assembly factor BamD [Candidatus Omnitrophota bacterium]
MKKKVFIFSLLCFFCLNAYSFWIWSPKTQKWKNPKYSPLATPFLQFKEGEKYFEASEYKEASAAFKKLLIHYPDSQEAAESQYYLGRCLEEMGQPYQAFLEYQKVIDSYPNSKRINEAVEREYKIGEYFLNRESKQWMGVTLYDFVEHPSIEIFKKIVEKVPYSAQASQAEYKLGLLLMKLSRFDEARETFQKVLDNYPDSEWATPSRYQLAIATSKASPGVGYDSTTLQEASRRLDEFIKKHPDAQISSQAEEQLKELRNKEARKNFDIASFYENQDKYESAILYYKMVSTRYPDSDYNQPALEKIKELSPLAEGNLTKKEFLEQAKQEEQERIRQAKEAKAGERYLQREKKRVDALARKHAIIQKNKEEKQKTVEEKKEKKKNAAQKKKALKAQQTQQKLETRARKEKIKQELAAQKKAEAQGALRKKRERKELKQLEKAVARKASQTKSKKKTIFNFWKSSVREPATTNFEPVAVDVDEAAAQKTQASENVSSAELAAGLPQGSEVEE